MTEPDWPVRRWYACETEHERVAWTAGDSTEAGCWYCGLPGRYFSTAVEARESRMPRPRVAEVA